MIALVDNLPPAGTFNSITRSKPDKSVKCSCMQRSVNQRSLAKIFYNKKQKKKGNSDFLISQF